MTASKPPDQKQRDLAIDTRASFIVQAPAGSGKTELLTQRYLALLATVEAPENILAITFTRKATAEMRRRIIRALTGQAPRRDAAAGAIADAACARDAKLDWRIADKPRRLRIQTIDAFCNELVWRMPWSSRFGAPPALAEDPAPLYAQAAGRALGHIEGDDEFAAAAAALLALVDANWGRARDLLASMLARRDQWLGALAGGVGGGDGDDDRARIEAFWGAEIERALAAARAAFGAFSPAGRKAWVELGAYAAGNLAADGAESTVSALRECAKFPGAKHADLDAWRGLAALALTKDGALRKTVTRRDGFPVDDDDRRAQKERFLGLLETARTAPGLAEALTVVRGLPGGQFADAEWRSVDALVKLLRVAAAELRLVFKERNQADYIELTQRAGLALGDADAPTDLALAFDYQLRHILMDEFQDTSSAHLQLLEQLTAGWQAGDGRTLFLVGDPMQSIYRFREAEVGNFLTAKEAGVGDIRLRALRLTANFRSAPALVEWFNATFAAVLPAADDAAAGAVSYAPADPCACIEGGAQVQAMVGDSKVAGKAAGAAAEAEAEAIADLIARILRQHPGQTIAVLGRTRRHLTAIAAALRARGIAFCGRDLERLSDRPPIRDLIALTRALHQPADRVAMLSLLRAPFCGLGLGALAALAENSDATATLPELWRYDARVAALGDDDRARLKRLTTVIDAALARRGRVSLCSNVEAAWLALGAPATMQAGDLDDCARYLDLLGDLEAAAVDITPAALRAAAGELWAGAGGAVAVELLTVHKAKGLEFDHVIVPRLDGGARGQDSPLLRWRKLPGELLIAPLPASEARGRDPFYRHLAHLEKQHEAFERGRLLYVACTRAKRRLHLFGRVARGKDDAPKPPAGDSLLALLWPQVAAEFERAAATDAANADGVGVEAGAGAAEPPPLHRLPLDWRPPPLPEGIAGAAAEAPAAGGPEQLEFSWAGETARITGVVIHQILQGIDAIGWEAWRRLANDPAGWRAQLLQNGLPERHLEAALAQIAAAIDNARDDPRAAWIFSAEHRAIRAEWELTGVVGGRIAHVVIDRSFVDRHGARWVIDFKSSRHEGGDVDAFLDRERERHRPQMALYAQVAGALAAAEVKLGLYFPALRGWREWPGDAAVA